MTDIAKQRLAELMAGLDDPYAWRSDMNARGPQTGLSARPQETLSPGPAPTGHDRVFDWVYNALGNNPEHRSTANALSNLFGLTGAPAAYDGGRHLAATGEPAELALAVLAGPSAKGVKLAKMATADNAMTAGVNALTQGAGSMGGKLPSIRAYHGSPHDFDKFDMSKIGSGEGAQAFGHGLYFAENERVARSYRNNLSPVTTQINGIDVDGFGKTGAPNQAMRYVAQHKGDIDGALRHLRSYNRDKYRREAAKWLSENRDSVSTKINGRMYEVNIKADPHDFLDWDNSLSQQPEIVKRYAAKELADYGSPGRDPLGMKGGEFYRGLDNASDKLRDAGIPGIRYLDRVSRSAGEGSRNYVVFDDKLIDIIRKYGLAGAMAMGVLGKRSDEASANGALTGEDR